MKTIYCVRDNVAGEVTGGLYVFPNDVAAIRFFTDVALDEQTIISKHLADFDLQAIGYLNPVTSELMVIAPVTVVITGAALQAARSPQRMAQES